MQLVPSASGTADYALAPLPLVLRRTLTDAEMAQLRKTQDISFELPSKACSTCDKQGPFKTRLADRTVVTCECNCLEQWMLGRLLLDAGIGDTYQRYSWHHVRGVPETVLSDVECYLSNLDKFFRTGMGMILWSERTGTGKSLLAYLILKHALSQGYRGHFVTFTQLVNLHVSGWRDKDHREWFTRKIFNAQFLVVDDLGKENQNRTAVVDEFLDDLIRTRIAHGRPTIITTNLDPSASQEEEGNVAKNFARYQRGVLDLLGERNMKIEVTGSGYREQVKLDVWNDSLEDIRYPVVIR